MSEQRSSLLDAMSALASSDAGKMDFRGRKYTPVAVRVERLREAYGDQCAIYSSLVHRDDESVVMQAEVWAVVNGDWVKLSTGFAEEVRGDSNVNKTSALENCETSAVGRALAALGLGGGEYASADELSNAVQAQSEDEIRLERMNEALKKDHVKQAVDVIKGSLKNGNLRDAAVAWFEELSDDDKKALWVAPTKGGCLSTEERKTIQSTEFREAFYGKKEEA